VQPCPERSGLNRLTSTLVRRQIRRATARLGATARPGATARLGGTARPGGTARGVVSAWPLFDVFGSCREQARIYWAQDDYLGGASLFGLSAQYLAARERAVAASADRIIAANPLVAGTWRDRHREVSLIPFGTDVAAYRDVDLAPLPPDASLAGPVAGFVGQINERIDLRLLEAVAERGHSLLLVGPKDPGFEARRLAALLRRRNVCWVGQKPFESLPGYLRRVDVGLVPYGDSAFNRGSFPLKTLEYLAAGRAVVATDLPAIQWLSTDLVTVATSPQAFADQVGHLLGQARTATVMTVRREFAAKHSWTGRAASFHSAILSACATQPPAGADTS
jgi:glycosyltransferase involved in cell wall biosynthesis